jgi:hypothetical protein
MTGLLLGLQLTAFSFQLSAAPDAETAVAVAIGLVRAEQASIEVPVSVEVAAIKPSARADLRTPETEAIEWVRTCDQYGCRLVPRMPSPTASQAPAPASSMPGGEEATSTAEGGRWRAKRGLFGRWR